MPRLLATRAALQRRLNTRDGHVDTTLLDELLEGASNRMEELTGRYFLPDPFKPGDGQDALPVPDPVALDTTRTAQAFGSAFCVAYDCRTATSIVADGTDVTAQARLVRIRPEHPAHAIRLPWCAREVVITGTFGWAEVPASVRDATLGWAQRAYHEHRARMSDAQSDPDGAGYVSYFRVVPPFVSAILDNYRVVGL